MGYTIGIDLGTTNTKVIALSEKGTVLCAHSQPTEVKILPTGGESDPRKLGADLLLLLREFLSDVRKVTDDPLTGIGLTGMAEAGCLSDLYGEHMTPIMLWYDRRGAEEAEELRPAHESDLTGISGIRMSNVATIYKLCWLKKHNPGSFGKGMVWYGVPEWAGWLLSARHFTDRTLAVRTGAYSLKTGWWSKDVLSITGLEAGLFPEIIDTLRQDVSISPEIADYLGVPENVRIVIAGHDDMAAAYGAGLSGNTWVDSTGTAEGMIALTDTLPDPLQTVRQRMSIAPWYFPNRWALIAGVGTSGSLLAELKENTGLSYEEIDRMAEMRADYPDDILKTELTPQRLAKVEFSPGSTAEQRVSAVYDRIITSFSERTRQLAMFAARPEKLMITGGQARLPELCRRKSEALGNIPVICRAEPEAAAYGAAILAGQCVKSEGC